MCSRLAIYCCGIVYSYYANALLLLLLLLLLLPLLLLPPMLLLPLLPLTQNKSGADAAWQTVSGIPLPSYRAFQLLKDAGDVYLPVSFSSSSLSSASSDGSNDAISSTAANGIDTTLSIFATRSSNGAATDGASSVREGAGAGAKIFLANFAPDDGLGSSPAYNYSRTVTLQLRGLPASTTSVSVATINSTCANPKQLWVTEMASVNWPNATQLQALRRASEVCTEQVPVLRHDYAATAEVTITLEPYAAAALSVPY